MTECMCVFVCMCMCECMHAWEGVFMIVYLPDNIFKSY